MLTVTVTTETARDRHGDPITTATQTVQALGFAPGLAGRASSSSSESVNNSQVRLAGILYFPPGMPHFPESTIFEFKERPEAQPTKWGIDGASAEWISPWDSNDAGCEVHVRRLTG